MSIMQNGTFPTSAADLAEREQDIFQRVVDAYIETGQPLGSRSLSKQLRTSLSPASVRNVMSDLEQLGLIFSPHTSAGRVPTEAGLRFFVDSFMEFAAPSSSEQESIENQFAEVISNMDQDVPLDAMLSRAGDFLSGLAGGAGLVLVSKKDAPIKHIEFVRLEPTRALAVLVSEDGQVENRVITIAAGTTMSQLNTASNYLNAHVAGRTLAQAREIITKLRSETRRELDELAEQLIATGIASWVDGKAGDGGRLIVRGRSRLLEDVSATEDLERARMLFDDLETKNDIISLLSESESGDGVRIFIGSENKLFSLSGSSVILAPYADPQQQIIGTIGIIGPTRLNYRRLIPVVDYTAQIMSRLMQKHVS